MTKPLDGIRILDFSRVLAAPMATQILADMGAEVIKVERPGKGDETRSFEPRIGDESAYFFAFNRGKKSITLDLRSDDDRHIVERLVNEVDVVVENFIPGTMDRYGLGWDRLHEINEQLIYVAASGFGQTGPERTRKGYDTVFQALSGVMHLTGEPESGPSKAGIPLADMTSGLWVAIAILTGLVGRGAHGIGTFVDIAMMDVQTSLLALAAARTFALDDDPMRTGTAHLGRVPSAAFECRDGWVQISGSDQHWPLICEVLGLDDLVHDPRLATNSGRVERREEVTEALSAAISSWTRDQLVGALGEHGIPAGEVRTVKEALNAPQTQARGMVGTFDHPTVGTFSALRTPVKFDSYDDPSITVPPLLGADNEAVLGVFDPVGAVRTLGAVEPTGPEDPA
ncbi:CoA transferase [Brevibacterium sp. K11IcPPYGO002]|uniref:CaiB/BaiF CoA transferase family protein n=1 Tax=Brevibacterium sp. K11IcPPYGO002 TaxID=3058837 RepID=UPI003D818128